MQGPDFKVGKTDIIDAQGNRVVTTTTNETTLDGKSIWTIRQEFDYDNDGKMDGFKKETLTYELNSGKLLEKTVEDNNTGAFKGRADKVKKHIGNEKYLYETATGNLVKTITTSDWHADGKIEEKEITNYAYDSEGREIKKCSVNEDYYCTKRKSVKEESKSYHKNGQLKKESRKLDFENDGTIDILNEHEWDEKGRLVRHRSDLHNNQNYEETIKYNDKNGTAEIEIKEFSTDGKNTLIGHTQKVVKVGKDGKLGKTISKSDLMSQDGDKKHPPMMGV